MGGFLINLLSFRSRFFCDILADFTLFRYNFRDGSNFVTGSSFQILGNENKGKRLVVAKLWGGMYRSSTLRSSRFGFLALLVIHVSLTERERQFVVHKFAHEFNV